MKVVQLGIAVCIFITISVIAVESCSKDIERQDYVREIDQKVEGPISTKISISGDDNINNITINGSENPNLDNKIQTDDSNRESEYIENQNESSLETEDKQGQNSTTQNDTEVEILGEEQDLNESNINEEENEQGQYNTTQNDTEDEILGEEQDLNDSNINEEEDGQGQSNTTQNDTETQEQGSEVSQDQTLGQGKGPGQGQGQGEGQGQGQGGSPEIYLYSKKTITEEIVVEIKEGVTKTIPEIELGPMVTWQDVRVYENGTLGYQGDNYKYLYYEGNFIQPNYISNYGWILEKNVTSLMLNNDPITLEELETFFKEELAQAGLYEREISDFIKKAFITEKMFENEEQTDRFKLAIYYIPQNTVDDIITIRCNHNFTQLRRHFLITPIFTDDLYLEPPIYITPSNTVESSNFILHEWGLNLIGSSEINISDSENPIMNKSNGKISISERWSSLITESMMIELNYMIIILLIAIIIIRNKL